MALISSNWIMNVQHTQIYNDEMWIDRMIKKKNQKQILNTFFWMLNKYKFWTRNLSTFNIFLTDESVSETAANTLEMIYLCAPWNDESLVHVDIIHFLYFRSKYSWYNTIWK